MSISERSVSRAVELPGASRLPMTGALALAVPAALGGLLLASPSVMTAATLFAAFAGVAVALARSVPDIEFGRLPRMAATVAFLSILQLTLAAYIAVAVGSIAGAAAFAGLLAADIFLSICTLLVLEREEGVKGVSSAWLVAAKYDGLLGRAV